MDCLDVAGLVKFNRDGTVSMQLRPKRPTSARPQQDDLVIGPPTPETVREWIQNEVIEVHPSKTPLTNAAIIVAMSNTQCKLKLAKGEWTTAAWNALETWLKAQKRNRTKGQALFALPAPPSEPSAPPLALQEQPSAEPRALLELEHKAKTDSHSGSGKGSAASKSSKSSQSSQSSQSSKSSNSDDSKESKESAGSKKSKENNSGENKGEEKQTDSDLVAKCFPFLGGDFVCAVVTTFLLPWANHWGTVPEDRSLILLRSLFFCYHTAPQESSRDPSSEYPATLFGWTAGCF